MSGGATGSGNSAILFRSLAVLLGTTVALLVAEGGLRLHGALTDPLRLRELAQLPRWSPPPGSACDEEAENHLAYLIELSPHPDIIYQLRPDLDLCFFGACPNQLGGPASRPGARDAQARRCVPRPGTR